MTGDPRAGDDQHRDPGCPCADAEQPGLRPEGMVLPAALE